MYSVQAVPLNFSMELRENLIYNEHIFVASLRIAYENGGRGLEQHLEKKL